MRVWKNSKTLCGTLALAFAVGGAACQQQVTTDNANSVIANANVASSPAVNTNASPVASITNAIPTREPEKYRATVVFNVEASGNKQQAGTLPTLDVARDGDNRRYAVTIPTIGPVIFLDRADKRYLIMEGRKQYVELNQQTTGFDVRSLTPGQMVVQLQKQPGVEKVDEEQLNNRTVTKYRYATTAHTTTQAGDVKTENFIYVDNDTGLPVRIEGYGQSTGNVQGMNNGKVVVEMRDIKTDVDPKLFDLPTGLTQLTQEQIKQQMAVLTTLFQVLMNGMNAQAGSNAPAATTTTTPLPTPSPSATAQ